jgi:hypothetical protein
MYDIKEIVKSKKNETIRIVKRENPYRMFHVERAKKIGILQEILLYELIDVHHCLLDRGELMSISGKEGLFFPYDYKQAKERLGISEKIFSRLIKSLCQQDLISYCLDGIPRQRKFIINYERIDEILNKE